MPKNYIIAIDGPAASGKSTVAQKLAKELNITYLSSGSIYRTITKVCLENKITAKNEKVKAILQNCNLSIKEAAVYVDDIDYTEFISLPMTEASVSKYSLLPSVRKKAMELLRDTAKNQSIVMDGRDIGSVVFPDAKHKIYLTATTTTRARRRLNEFVKKNPSENLSLAEMIQEIIERDRMDRTRAISPLIQAKDAISIDNSNLDIEQTIQKIYNHIDTV